MQALRLQSTKLLQLQDVPDPVPSPGEVLINIEAVSIGGSEYLGYNNPGLRPLPSIMGHGITGTTPAGQRVAVYPLSGCGVCEFCTADQVQLCDQWALIGVQSDGGFAQRIAVPEQALFPLPAQLSWEQAVFIEPFANAVNAWALAGVCAEDSIAVIGAGSLGLGLVAMARETGCDIVHVRDLSSARIQAACSAGANGTVGRTENRYDVVFDTVGSTETRSSAIKITRNGGKCVFMGFATPDAQINMSEVIRQQKTLIGAFVYSKSQFEQAIERVSCCKDEWVRNISLAEVEGCLTQFLAGKFDTVKIALRPNGYE